MRLFLVKFLDLHEIIKRDMKRLQHIALLLLMILSTSCGEDRTGEFYALIEDRMWIEDIMQENYLWAEDMPVIEDEDEYFKEPATFFKNLLSKNAMDGKGDKYSYMEIEQRESEEENRSMMLNRTSTYGMEFALTNDPTGTTAHTFARILYVLPDSPAEKAGIQRGDWISAINKDRITTDNYHQMIQGGAVSLARNEIIHSENGYAWQSRDTLNVGPSVQMEINPFFINTVYEVNGQRIAYLVYNEFSTGPNNNDNESVYNEQMKQIFTQFKSQSPDAFILDLRYNNGGYLQCAQALGSLLAPASAIGKDFINLTFNAQTEPQVEKYPFSSEYANANLNLNKVYILTGSQTASSSEAVINGLIPYMGKDNVILIGSQTEGKNVAMSPFKNETYGYTLWPVIAYVSNADNEGNFSEGFTPQYDLNEFSVPTWLPLGNPEEFLLKNALALITTGSLPDISTPSETKTNVLLTSIASKGIYIK